MGEAQALRAALRAGAGPRAAGLALLASLTLALRGEPAVAAGQGETGAGHAVLLAADCRRDPPACGAVRAAVERLGALPRRHSLVVVPPGAAAGPEAPGGQSALALLDVVSATTAGVRLARAAADGASAVTPAWLVHASLRAASAAGVQPSVEPSRPGWGQLLARATLPVGPSAADRALAAGIPAVRLAVPEGETGALWVSAVVRRLDELGGRPRAEAEYLTAAGRVWTRRSLYWIGGALWAALVLARRPGAWRRTADATRRRRGGRYLLGLPFRFAFLLALLWAPSLALPLLGPAALAALWSGGGVRWRIAGRIVAYAPAVLFGLGLAAAVVTGEAVPRRPGAAAWLVALALLAWELQARRPAPATGPSTRRGASRGRP